MSLLKVKAKVLLQSEEQMEVDEKYDLGDIAKSKEWVWKNIAVPIEEIYRVIEFNKSKCILQMYDGERILLSEDFDSVYNKWSELKDVVQMIELADETSTS